MSKMRAEVASFLAEAGWGSARVAPLKADASNRRYFRLELNQTSTILMDAPPDLALRTSEFVEVTRLLRQQGLAAPEILHQDLANGFLLLEDLGSHTFADHLLQHPTDEPALYAAATEALSVLRTSPGLDRLEIWTPKEMAEIALLAWSEAGASQDASAKAKACLIQAFSMISDARATVCLRDFHAENLIWRADRSGVDRVGLLDYQDAVATHPIYDFVSLTRDARRDVLEETRHLVTEAYADQLDLPLEVALQDAAIMGAQRSLRILGIFSKLARGGKPGYLRFVPRVRRHLEEDLRHPALADLRKLVHDDLSNLANTETEHGR